MASCLVTLTEIQHICMYNRAMVLWAGLGAIVSKGTPISVCLQLLSAGIWLRIPSGGIAGFPAPRYGASLVLWWSLHVALTLMGLTRSSEHPVSHPAASHSCRLGEHKRILFSHGSHIIIKVHVPYIKVQADLGDERLLAMCSDNNIWQNKYSAKTVAKIAKL